MKQNSIEKPDRFSWDVLETKMMFDQLRDYFKIMSDGAEVIKEKYEKIIEQELSQTQEVEEEVDIMSQAKYQQHFYQFESNLPRQLSFSFITLFYALLENRVKSISEFIEEKKISPI